MKLELFLRIELHLRKQPACELIKHHDCVGKVITAVFKVLFSLLQAVMPKICGQERDRIPRIQPFLPILCERLYSKSMPEM